MSEYIITFTMRYLFFFKQTNVPNFLSEQLQNVFVFPLNTNNMFNTLLLLLLQRFLVLSVKHLFRKSKEKEEIYMTKLCFYLSYNLSAIVQVKQLTEQINQRTKINWILVLFPALCSK